MTSAYDHLYLTNVIKRTIKQ